MLPQYMKVTLRDITFHEEEYKGYQLIVIGWQYESQLIFDKNDEPFTHSQIEEDEIGRYGEVQHRPQYAVYAWRIGDTESVSNLNYLSALATLGGICSSVKEKVTLKSARKKLDLLAKIDAVKGEIALISDHRVSKPVNPYNITTGEYAYIQAFGRLRKGKIVDTTGSRFIVAYCTPSNTRDLKYKTLPLSRLWVEA
jgi:hypothetical protein